MSKMAKIDCEGHELEFPVVEGTEKEKAIDISALRKQTGLITIDEGYVNTGSTKSGITFLNGEEGILRYRGYPIEELAKNCDFVEVAYLLIYGELPNQTELSDFSGTRFVTTRCFTKTCGCSTTAFLATHTQWLSCRRLSVRCRPFIRIR